MNSQNSQAELVKALVSMEEQVSSLKSIVDLLPRLYCFKSLSPEVQSVVKEQLSLVQDEYRDISHFILVSQLNLLCQKQSEGTDSAWNYSEPRNYWTSSLRDSIERPDLILATTDSIKYDSNVKKNSRVSYEPSSQLTLRSPPHICFNSFQNEVKSISLESRFPSLFKGNEHILLDDSESNQSHVIYQRQSPLKKGPTKKLKVFKPKSKKVKPKKQPTTKSIFYINDLSDILTAKNTRRGKRYIFDTNRKNIDQFNAELKKCLPKLGFKRGCVLSYSKIRDIALALNRMRNFLASPYWFKNFCKYAGYKRRTR